MVLSDSGNESAVITTWCVLGLWWTGTTCELQRAAQGALSRGQQRQAGVFGLRVLQTLDQGDGRVLDKLHQQLMGRREEPQHKNKHSQGCEPMSYSQSHNRLPLVWSQAHQKASPCVEPVGQQDDTDSIKLTLILRRFKSNRNNPHLKFDLLNVGLSVGHRRTGQVISGSEPSHNLRSKRQDKTSI